MGPDGAEGHQTEAVCLRLLVASYVGNTHSEGQNERHRHRTGCNSSRVESYAQEVGVCERR